MGDHPTLIQSVQRELRLLEIVAEQVSATTYGSPFPWRMEDLQVGVPVLRAQVLGEAGTEQAVRASTWIRLNFSRDSVTNEGHAAPAATRATWRLLYDRWRLFLRRPFERRERRAFRSA